MDEQPELSRCFYNFVRPHSALRSGKVTRTPAMQAGLAWKPLSLMDVFTTRCAASRLAAVRSAGAAHHEPIESFRCAA